jgi:hypothetical protein
MRVALQVVSDLGSNSVFALFLSSQPALFHGAYHTEVEACS